MNTKITKGHEGHEEGRGEEKKRRKERRRVGTQFINTADALFEDGDVEIDQQSHAASGQFQICQCLGDMEGKQSFRCLDLQDQLALDEEVDAEAAFKSDVVVDDGNRYLALAQKAGTFQLETKTLLVNRFQKSGAQTAMNGQGKADNAR